MDCGNLLVKYKILVSGQSPVAAPAVAENLRNHIPQVLFSTKLASQQLQFDVQIVVLELLFFCSFPVLR